MSIAPDSNITSASDEETIFIDLGGVDLPFERNPTEVETSGWGSRSGRAASTSTRSGTDCGAGKPLSMSIPSLRRRKALPGLRLQSRSGGAGARAHPQRSIPVARAVGPCTYIGRARCPLAAASTPRSVAGMEPDATYKYILSSAFMVEELMHWLVADRHGLHALVEALDFATLTRVHEQSVTGDGEALRRRSNDMVWRVHLRERGTGADGTQPESSGAWLYLVVMLEFQSTVDYLMALRVRSYVDRFHTEQWRARRFRATDRLAPVLAHRALHRQGALERRGTGHRPGDAAGGGHRAWGGDRDRHRGRPAGPGPARRMGYGRPTRASRATATCCLTRTGSGRRICGATTRRHCSRGLENPLPSTLPELVGAVCRRLWAPELRGLREMMLSWAGWRARQAGLTIEADDMAQVNRMENPDDVEAFYRDASPDMGRGTSRRGASGGAS